VDGHDNSFLDYSVIQTIAKNRNVHAQRMLGVPNFFGLQIRHLGLSNQNTSSGKHLLNERTQKFNSKLGVLSDTCVMTSPVYAHLISNNDSDDDRNNL